LGAGFGLSRATSYRYHDEVLAVLSARALDLTESLEQVQAEGWSHVILDGKVVDSDRCAPLAQHLRATEQVIYDTDEHFHFVPHRTMLYKHAECARPHARPTRPAHCAGSLPNGRLGIRPFETGRDLKRRRTASTGGSGRARAARRPRTPPSVRRCQLKQGAGSEGIPVGASPPRRRCRRRPPALGGSSSR
jgi:hypothetical protein